MPLQEGPQAERLNDLSEISEDDHALVAAALNNYEANLNAPNAVQYFISLLPNSVSDFLQNPPTHLHPNAPRTQLCDLLHGIKNEELVTTLGLATFSHFNQKPEAVDATETLVTETPAVISQAMRPLQWLDSDQLNTDERFNLRSIFSAWIENRETDSFSGIPQRIIDYINANAVQMSEMRRQLRLLFINLGGTTNQHHAEGLSNTIVDWIKEESVITLSVDDQNNAILKVWKESQDNRDVFEALPESLKNDISTLLHRGDEDEAFNQLRNLFSKVTGLHGDGGQVNSLSRDMFIFSAENQDLTSLDDLSTVHHPQLEDAFRCWKEHHDYDQGDDDTIVETLKLLPAALKRYLVSAPDPEAEFEYYCQNYIGTIDRHAFQFSRCIIDWVREENDIQKMAAGLDDVTSLDPILDASGNHWLAPEDVPPEPLQNLLSLTPAEENRLTTAVERFTDIENPDLVALFTQNVPQRILDFIEHKLRHRSFGYPLSTNVRELFRSHGLDMKTAESMAELLVQNVTAVLEAERDERESLGLNESMQTTLPAKAEPPAFLAEEEKKLSARAEAHAEFKALCDKYRVYDHILLNQSKFEKGTYFDRVTAYSKKRFRIVGIDYAGRNIQIAEVVRGKFNDKAPGVPFEKVVTEYLKK